MEVDEVGDENNLADNDYQEHVYSYQGRSTCFLGGHKALCAPTYLDNHVICIAFLHE